MLAAMVMTFAVALAPSAAAVEFVTIGTGGVTGVYYPAGGAVAKIINKDRKALGIRASVESTGGSVYNINAVLSGDLQIGIAQSDRQYQASKGLAEWEGKPQEKLRAICSLHPEVVTLIATVDSGIADVMGLKGKRVNIGNPGSGQRGNSLDVLTAFGLDAAEAPRVLQDGRLDAFFYTVGHPNGNITEATTGGRTVTIVPISGEAVDKLVAEKPYYAKATIPHRLYGRAANKADIPSFGVTATMVTSADVSEETVYKITKQLFTNLDALKGMHPALNVLTPESMLSGLSAPIHPGAMKYYKEAGLK
jgi:TRAP transporter TAXI family solute receptor